MHPIGDCAVVEERCEHLVQGVVEVIEAADVEEGLLLAREGRIRQVFGGGRRTNGDRKVLAAAHLFPGAADVLH